ncbi:MAG: V-type ATP synthase subunit I [Spirochaetaceae bacterium]|nr:V-type ATP synthase subunit I [Spirochaetaceae bacterium]
MIVPMKKVYLVTLDYLKEKALIKLRKAGVVHLEKSFGTSENLEKMVTERTEMEQALNLLDSDKSIKQEELKSFEIHSIKKKILELGKKKIDLEDERDSLQKEISRIEIWDDFEPADIEILRSKGIDIRLYKLSKDELKKVPKEYELISIHQSKSVNLMAIVSLDGSFPQEIEEFTLPDFGLAELRDNLELNGRKYTETLNELQEMSVYRDILIHANEKLKQDIEFEQYKTGMAVDETLVYLAGYIPADRQEELKELALKEQWALSLNDPAEDDPVPTAVKNNKLVSIIQPVFDMLGTIPSYDEYDISGWFLLFFSIFYAMIIGDGGYGLIFLSLAVLINLISKKVSPIVGLLYLISTTTIIWGAITGTWFGSVTIASIPFLKGLIIPQIASFPEILGRSDITASSTQELIKTVCFIMGTVHLSIAHIKNFLKELPRLASITQLGWLSMVLGLYFLVMQLVLGIGPVPQFAMYMIYGGLISVFIFGQQERGVNFFKGILKGLGGFITTFLDAIGAFSDIISYIRLFAVGLASVAIAASFNAMAEPLMHGPAFIGAIVILLLGHTLNLAMGLLSVIVHGVRLNMLEFSGHLGMEWAGIKYEPFKARD